MLDCPKNHDMLYCCKRQPLYNSSTDWDVRLLKFRCPKCRKSWTQEELLTTKVELKDGSFLYILPG